MQQEINYKKASAYYLFGNIFNKGVSFLTVPIFTRLLSTYDYGIVTTYNSWIGILSMIMGFALHMGIRMAFVDYKDEVDDFTATTVFFTIVSSIGMGALIVLGARLLNANLTILLIVICLIHSLSTAIIQDYSMYLMMKFQYKFRTLLMVLPNLIAVILSVLSIKFILSEKLYMGRIVPTAAVYVTFGIIICGFVFAKSHVLWNIEYLKYGLAISAPLIVHGIALQILSQSDRTMITWLADASQTGIYSLIYNFSMIASVITTAFDGTWVPWFIENLQKRNIKRINQLAMDYTNLMTYTMVSLILVAPEVVKLLADPSYWEGIVIIPPVVLANYMIFAYTLYVNIEHYYKKTVYITINTLIAAGTNIILNYIFIPKYGYVAAAYTTIASYILSFILHSRYAKKLEPDLYPLKSFLRPFCHILIASFVFYFLVDDEILRWSIAIVYILVMLFRERKRILEFFPKLEKYVPHRKK